MKTESSVELTLRGLVLGVVLTVVFTAANVYFGLKAGLTFSTSIPAVVISMAMLRWLGNTSAQENNIVQTVASTVCTMLFSWAEVLPSQRNIAMEITTAGMEVEKVSPAFSPK